jgi:Leucine-rich repeat (LRR) protein
MNRLISLPDSFATLTSLVNLDLSHNALIALPPHIFSLPALSLLDISHNAFTALPFNIPFESATSPLAPTRRSNDFFSAPELVRATCPLPNLASFDASHNKIVSSAIHRGALPQNLRTFNLACNPLGDIAELLTSLSALAHLVDLRMSRCDIDDTSFPASLLSSASTPIFPKLTILDLEETHATQATVSRALSDLSQTIDFEASITDVGTVPPGILAVAVGKRIVREAWEIEADRHVQRLREKRSAVNLGGIPTPELPQPLPQSTEVEQGLLPNDARSHPRAESTSQIAQGPETDGATAVPSHTAPVLRRYWDPRTLTLTLPPSPGRPTRHNAGASTEEEILPRATLPLSLIATQPFAETLRILELRGRHAEPAFVLPTPNGQSLLPQLETLSLEGCALSDAIPGASTADSGALGVLAQLFPGLRNLELGYNNFTGNLVARNVLEQVLFAGKGGHAGLRRLGLCGNRIEELHGLRELARVVFGTDAASERVELRAKWTLEELDVRENSIAGLPGELGLLPLDLFLVDGNL